MTRGFTLAQMVYAFFFVIFYHGYFKKEQPFVAVDIRLSYNNLVRLPCLRRLRLFGCGRAERVDARRRRCSPT